MGYATNDEVRRSLESAKNEVAVNIIQAKDDAIAAAKQHVDNSNFATKTDLGNLELGTDEETVKKKDMYWQYLNTPLSSIDFTELKKQNKDTVGWLIVNNTKKTSFC